MSPAVRDTSPLGKVAVEGVIWSLLALSSLYQNGSDFVVVVTIAHLVGQQMRAWYGSLPPHHNPKLWRHVDHVGTDSRFTGDSMGLYMSITLVPLLFQSIAVGLDEPQKWQLLWIGRIVSLMQIPLWHHVSSPILQIQQMQRHASVLLAFPAGMVFLPFIFSWVHSHDVSHRTFVSTIAFTWSWLVGLSMLGPGKFKALRGIMSVGEWFVISSLLAFVFSQFATTLMYLRTTTVHGSTILTTPFKDTSYAFVAAAGVFGCAFACSSVGTVQSFVDKLLPTRQEGSTSMVALLFRIIYLVTIPLGFLDLCFWYHPRLNEKYPFPKCLWWIFGDFLMTVEESPWHPWTNLAQNRPTWSPIVTNGINQILQLPRISWLVYWAISMTFTIPFAPSAGTISPVIARKWFHFVAIVLFVPSTIFVPELQSLSYAIGICVLLLIELIRHDLSWLNHFYVTYLDSDKDEKHDATIISHIALVAGCATPLWLVQYYSYYGVRNVATSTHSSVLYLLLGLWGVWVLGIGDAMGAIIGRNYGRLKWGFNHRTVEGSAAMMLSLCMTCIVTSAWFDSTSSWTDHVRLWLPAVVLVTFLEAYTMQIDNIVLPLAGAAVICSMFP